MKKYRVNEIFYSLQGEGFYTGTPAVFLRFAGCNRACPFCDTDFKNFTAMDADEIAEAVAAFPARHLVATGGEPLLQLDSDLLRAIKARGFYVQVETNGSMPCSPSGWGNVRQGRPRGGYRIGTNVIRTGRRATLAFSAALSELLLGSECGTVEGYISVSALRLSSDPN